MLYRSFAGDKEEEIDDIDDEALAIIAWHQGINHKTMFTLAIATSIDAMAAGFA